MKAKHFITCYKGDAVVYVNVNQIVMIEPDGDEKCIIYLPFQAGDRWYSSVIYKHSLCELMEIINAIGEPGA